jgi:hypothetical protein
MMFSGVITKITADGLIKSPMDHFGIWHIRPAKAGRFGVWTDADREDFRVASPFGIC